MTTSSSTTKRREDEHDCRHRRHVCSTAPGESPMPVQHAMPTRARFRKRRSGHRDSVMVKMYLALVIACGYGWSHFNEVISSSRTSPKPLPSLYEQALQQAKQHQSERLTTRRKDEPPVKRQTVGGGSEIANSLSMTDSFKNATHNESTNNDTESSMKNDKVEPSPGYRDLKFLIFDVVGLTGQGQGNLLNGLLSVHLLGEEFDRIVCVSPQYKSFHLAFEAIHPLAAQHCPTLFRHHPVDNLQPKDLRQLAQLRINIINFQSPPDECELQQRLVSSQKAWYISSNTYPRWRRVPSRFFERFYRPTAGLREMLPKGPPPETVVHLRLQDGRADERKGLNDASLNALGELLSKESTSKPYLVTNNVPWYKRFEKYRFNHPPWQGVEHSALRGHRWGTLAPEAISVDRKATSKEESKRTQILELWSDWYCILTAKKVYHTHSDFSLSAIHWMGSRDDEDGSGPSMTIWSRTINGFDSDTNQLILIEESWIREGEEPKVVDRTGDQLKNCQGESQTKKQRRDVIDWYDDDDSHHPEARDGKKKIIQATTMSESETMAFYQRALIQSATKRANVSSHNGNSHNSEIDFQKKMQDTVNLFNSESHLKYNAQVADLLSKAMQLKQQQRQQLDEDDLAA